MTFAEGSQLEKIGKNCFYGTGIEEFLAPQSLREIENGVFTTCKSLRRVVLNEGLERLGRLRSEDGKLHYGVFGSTGIK